MIISRTPVRISLGGGGTDLASFYRSNGGGFVIAAAISRHVYLAINHHFQDDIFLKYSHLERATSVDAIEHPLFREALRATGVNRHVEISSMADVPSDTGLGSSGSFTVGLLKALYAYQRQVVTNLQLALEACRIEIEVLGDPVGKQDQYIAAVGGLTAFRIDEDGSVEVVPVPVSEDSRNRLEENLLLFYTGVRRSSSKILAGENDRSKAKDPEIGENLRHVKQIGHESFDALVAGDLKMFSRLMTDQWELKKSRSPESSTRQIDDWIKLGLDSGAWGAKLVGAGGGGFLLFYSEAKTELRAAMASQGLQELRFAFDYEGSKLLVS